MMAIFRRLLLAVALLSCSVGADPGLPHVFDIAVMGQSLASGDVRYGETLPVAELEGSDVVRWHAGAWTKALASAGAATSPGIGQWQAVWARDVITHDGVTSVRFVNAVQNGVSISFLVPGTGNYIAWAAAISASGATPRILVFWHGASDHAMAPAAYEGHLAALWTQAKIDAPSLEVMLIVEAFDWVGGSAIHCGQDMWRVRMARGAFADDNADVHLLDLSEIPIGPDTCHLTWAANKQAARMIAVSAAALIQ